MAADIYSEQGLWFALFQIWNGQRDGIPREFEVELDKLNGEIDGINSAGGDIGRLSSPPVTIADVYAFWERGKKLWDFTNSIHYELAELVDLPFATSVGKVLNDAYALNPGDITVTGKSPFSPNIVSTYPFSFLMTISSVDLALKRNLDALAHTLNTDTISPTAQNILQEADFWQGEFEKAAEIRKLIDQVFTPEVRAAWPNMTPEMRDEKVQEFVRLVGYALGGSSPLVTELQWGENTFSPYDGTFIHLSDGFLQYADGVASNVERLIDAIVHEGYHKFQYEVSANPAGYGAPQELADSWNEKYISPKESKAMNADNPSYYYLVQPLEYDTRAFASLCLT